MSDLAESSALSLTSPQLPVSWYFDPVIYDLEMKHLFKHGPGYVGHQLMVPEAGDYHALELFEGGKVLVNSGAGIELLSNVCRHRQAIMLKGRGKLPSNNIVCPIHRWTYDAQGKLLGAPEFPGNPCLNLNRTGLQAWQGLLFAGARDVGADLAGMQAARELDFTGFMLDRVDVTHYACNWKTFIEVYLEDYHVAPYHPGLGHFVTCDDLKWEYGDWWSVQTVGINRALAKPGSPVYQKWHEQVLAYERGQAPKHGAIWLTYYPGLMVEWYPHVLVVSSILPTGVESCSNVVEFYYPEDIALFERAFVEAEQAAYHETAVEDEDICLRMHEGRRALHRQGISETGPYQSPLEDGMMHFHAFMRREIGPHLDAARRREIEPDLK
ncbi:MAG: aromatic ring-hydroxylating oxygenase subunit alpha [Thiobacillus sp.]